MAQDSWNGNGIIPTGDGSGDLWDMAPYVTGFDELFREYNLRGWNTIFGNTRSIHIRIHHNSNRKPLKTTRMNLPFSLANGQKLRLRYEAEKDDECFVQVCLKHLEYDHCWLFDCEYWPWFDDFEARKLCFPWYPITMRKRIVSHVW